MEVGQTLADYKLKAGDVVNLVNRQK